MASYEELIKEEQILWEKFTGGDDSSLEVIYRRYFDELYGFGMKWLKNRTLTKDAIQDLFIKLIQKREGLSKPTSVKYYLFRALRSVVLDTLRSQNKIRLIDHEGSDVFILQMNPENQVIASEEKRLQDKELLQALNRLTPRQREAIYLRYIKGFSYEEVSEMMELSTKGAYKLMARAIEALKGHFTAPLTSMGILAYLHLFYNS